MNKELRVIQNILSSEILLEELKYLNSRGLDKWAITFDKKDSIRVHFAKIVVLTISHNQIWMSVNPDLINENHQDIWKWDLEAYPVYTKYKKIKIHNGYIINPTLKNWNELKKCHFDIINQIAKTKYVLDIRTIRNQNKYIFHELSRVHKIEYPIPSYVLQKEFDSFESSEVRKIISENITQTEKEQIAKIRIGQKYFRQQLLDKYGKCIICGLQNKKLLRASHIKKWSESKNDERLDVNNGFLFCALHDSLFDSGLITFSSDGQIMISEDLGTEDLKILKIENLKIETNQDINKYLNWHRKNEFKEKSVPNQT